MGETQSAVSETIEADICAEQGVAVILSDSCRSLRKRLPALAWVILEQVALDAVLHEGRLLARTSAGHIAEQLSVNSGTAARALRMLREKGLLVLHREPGQAGRFGVAVYQINSVDGLMIKRPAVNASCMMHASPDGALVRNPSAVKASVVAPLMENPHVVKPPSEARRSRAVNSRPPPPALHGGAQVTLDLELGS